MPSSPNRRRLEVPTDLYARLEGEAQRRQVTAAALATQLLAEALDRAGEEGAATGGQVLGEVRDALRQLLEGEARQSAALQALRGELVRALPQLRAVRLTKAAPSRAADLARTFDPKDWTELRVIGRDGQSQAKALIALFDRPSPPPIAREYLQLLIAGDLAPSPQVGAEFLRRAEEMREQIEVFLRNETDQREKE